MSRYLLIWEGETGEEVLDQFADKIEAKESKKLYEQAYGEKLKLKEVKTNDKQD